MSKDEALRLSLGALEEMLAAERATNRPPETVMQALEKLDRIRKAVKQCENAITAIKEALAQPEEEPLAWFRYETVYEYKNQLARCTKDCIGAFPVYTFLPKREWQGLTDEERKSVVQDRCLNVGDWNRNGESVARAIEAKLKEKNT